MKDKSKINSKRVQKHFSLPSRTKQSFTKECDVNEIIKRFVRSGDQDVMREIGGYLKGTYGDFSEVVDYRTALDQVIAAEASFMALPAKVRKRFDNDPAEFLDFVQNPENLDEMRELGLTRITEAAQKAEQQEAKPSEITE